MIDGQTNWQVDNIVSTVSAFGYGTLKSNINIYAFRKTTYILLEGTCYLLQVITMCQ